MRFGSNYASLRIPYGDPLKVIQFRFGEYETTDKTEIAMLKKHPETFVIGGESHDAGTGDGDKKPKSPRKSSNAKQRSNSGHDGQLDSADGEHRDADSVS